MCYFCCLFAAADDFPVLAFTGAPAPFPVQPENIPIQVNTRVQWFSLIKCNVLCQQVAIAKEGRVPRIMKRSFISFSLIIFFVYY